MGGICSTPPADAVQGKSTPLAIESVVGKSTPTAAAPEHAAGSKAPPVVTAAARKKAADDARDRRTVAKAGLDTLADEVYRRNADDIEELDPAGLLLTVDAVAEAAECLKDVIGEVTDVALELTQSLLGAFEHLPMFGAVFSIAGKVLKQAKGAKVNCHNCVVLGKLVRSAMAYLTSVMKKSRKNGKVDTACLSGVSEDVTELRDLVRQASKLMLRYGDNKKWLLMLISASRDQQRFEHLTQLITVTLDNMQRQMLMDLADMQAMPPQECVYRPDMLDAAAAVTGRAGAVSPDDIAAGLKALAASPEKQRAVALLLSPDGGGDGEDGLKAVMGTLADATALLHELSDQVKAVHADVRKLQIGVDTIVNMLEETEAEGSHLVIKDPTLQRLWKKHSRNNESVSWDGFWNFFPDGVTQVPLDDLENLKTLLNNDAHKAAFEGGVDQGSRTQLSTGELITAFPLATIHLGFLDRVRALVEAFKKSNPNVIKRPSQHPRLVVPCMLAPKCAFVGREDQLVALVQAMQMGAVGSQLCTIVGVPGMGTTAFANEVGHRMFAAFEFPGGAYYLDLRTDKSIADVMQSIVQKVTGSCVSATGAEEGLRTCMSKLQALGKPVLIIFDHCDALFDKHKKEMLELLHQLMVIHVCKLTLCICTKLRVKNMFVANVKIVPTAELGSLAAADAAAMLCKLVPELPLPDAEAIAKTCGQHPMLLSLMGNRLNQYSSDELSREVSDVRNASLADIMKEGGSLLDNVTASLESAITTLNKAKPSMMLLALFPGAFNSGDVQQMLSLRTVKDANELINVAVTGRLAVREDPTRGDVHFLQPIIGNVMRGMLQDPQKISDGGLSVEEVLQARRQLVLFTRKDVQGQTDFYRHSPKCAFDYLALHKANVAEVLRLPEEENNVAVAKLCLGECVSLLRLLPYVDVYDKELVRSACIAFGQLSVEKGELWWAATCTAVGALFRAAEWAALGATLKQVQEMKASLPPPTTLDQKLLTALLWRVEGLIERDLYESIPRSVEAFRQALLVGAVAFGSSNLGQMDRIINLAELTGTLDYLGKDGLKEEGMQEGMQFGEDSVRAAEKFLGQVTDHPLLALCLNNLSFFFKMAGRYEECVAANERALGMRVKAFGRTHVDVAVSLNQKAISLVELGRFDEASTHNSESLEIRRACLEPDDPMVANTLFNIGEAKRRQGTPASFAEAEAAYREAYGIRIQKFPKPGHKKVKEVQVGWALLLRTQERDEEAIAVEAGDV